MLVVQWLFECETFRVDRLDDPLFGLHAIPPIRPRPHQIRRRDNYSVAGSPTGYRLRERNRSGILLRRSRELDPGPIHRYAVEVHPPSAVDDRRPRILIDAVEIH